MRRAVPAHSAPRHARQVRRRRRRIALLAVLALLIVSVSLLLALGRRHHNAPEPSSIIRLPRTALNQQVFWRSGAPWSAADQQRLQHDVAPIIDDAVFPSTTGVLIADVRTGRTLYAHNAQLPLIPGSTVKLVTAAAALSELGPQYRFATSIVTNGAITDGTLDGSLWLVGGGDPELTSDDLRRGVHMLALHSIDSISGNVYADGSLYGGDAVNATWLPEDLQYGWAAPAGAISIDENSVQFTVTPQASGEATVAIDPPGAADHVIASVTTTAADAENTLRIDALPNGTGYEISGQIPYGAPQKYWRSLPHPTQTAANSLLKMLRLAGISVQGTAAESVTPAQVQTLWLHRSRPLEQIVQRMFFDSDNHIAEELLRAVGWKTFGMGTLPKSVAAERAFLARYGLLHAGVGVADGSGLSAENKISAQTLAAVLQVIARQPRAEPYKLLPRAGIEGTVAVRNLTAAKGRVYAKDGYIAGASGLAGFILTAHHGPVIFVFLVNNWENGLDGVWAGEDQILDRLARY